LLINHIKIVGIVNSMPPIHRDLLGLQAVLRLLMRAGLVLLR
jgi:hypothetical protein